MLAGSKRCDSSHKFHSPRKLKGAHHVAAVRSGAVTSVVARRHDLVESHAVRGTVDATHSALPSH